VAVEEVEVDEELYDEASVPTRQPPAASLLSQGLPRRPPSDNEEDQEDYENDWNGEWSFLLHFYQIITDEFGSFQADLPPIGII